MSDRTPAPDPRPSAKPQSTAERSSIIAVTALPVLVILAGIAGFLSPDTFTPLAPTITWSLGVVTGRPEA